MTAYGCYFLIWQTFVIANVVSFTASYASLTTCYMKKFALTFFVFQLFCFAALSQLRVTQLRCENKINPSGITTMQPRLSWLLTSNVCIVQKTAYEIRSGADAAVLKAGKNG